MVSKIDSMKRIFLLALGCAALAAVTAAHSHAQNSSPPATKTAIFAGGCFWCIQPAFDKANGVIKTVVGYSGGTEPNPTYQLISSERTNYRESIEITYDPAKISYEQLLDIYWRQIDPTQADGQFTDKPIVTEILPAMKFYPAEAYHQKYYQQNSEHFEAFEQGSGRVSFKKKTWGER